MRHRAVPANCGECPAAKQAAGDICLLCATDGHMDCVEEAGDDPRDS